MVLIPLVGGCRSLTSKRSEAPEVPLTQSAAEAQELPASLAAKACLATAVGLSKKDFYAEAAIQYEKARQYDPSLEVSRPLAVLYARLGLTERASAEFALAIAAAPGDADLLNDAGYFYSARESWEEAETLLTRAVKANPAHAKAWNNLGLVLTRTDRAAEGYAAFARVLKPAEAAYNVGLLLAGQGEIPAARENLEKALALDPKLDDAKVVLARLGESPPVR